MATPMAMFVDMAFWVTLPMALRCACMLALTLTLALKSITSTMTRMWLRLGIRKRHN